MMGHVVVHEPEHAAAGGRVRRLKIRGQLAELAVRGLGESTIDVVHGAAQAGDHLGFAERITSDRRENRRSGQDRAGAK